MMLRPFVPMLTGFLILACVWLWTFARLGPQNMMVQSQTHGHSQNAQLRNGRSPMDMPDWYRRPLEQGARYVEIGPMRLADEKSVQTHRKAAVRGYW